MSPRNVPDAASNLLVRGSDGRGGAEFAIGIVGVARLTEAKREAVEFRAVHDIGHGLRGGTERDRQDARGERIERAAVTGLLRVECAADAVDHVGAGQPRWFVNDQPAVERTAAGPAAGHGAKVLGGRGVGG